MSFLGTDKKLTEATEKISSLESQLAQAAAKVSELTEACSVATKQAADAAAEVKTHKAAAEATDKLLKETADALAAEKSAHEATKGSVDTLASAKAQQILASAGHKPVPTPAAGTIGLLEKYRAMKPGKERQEFRLANWDALKSVNN